jgi:O-antigen/teichoic acid export membrane protein
MYNSGDKMTKESRLKNTSKNILSSFLNQLIFLIATFVSRTIFIHYLGIEILGINSLFSNILRVLSMADMGMSTAMIYSMYQPLAENNKKELSALTHYYGKIYYIIAVVVFSFGVVLIPFLDSIVNTEQDIQNLVIYYLLYLLNTVLSYLFVSKTAITTSDQKQYHLNNYDSIFIIIQNFLQIVVIILFRNFIMYLIVQLVVSIARNAYIALKSVKMYPFIIEKNSLAHNKKKEIFHNISSIFIYKIGSVLLNNTDNIIISIIVGTVMVGYYSNYLLIVTSITIFTNLLFNSMTASIGNLNVVASREVRYQYFKRVNFIAFWIFSFCGICLFILLNDFITLWLGSNFVIDIYTVAIIVLNFVMPGTIRTVSMYRDTTGMFKQTKYVYLITALVNLVLSVVLGRLLGLAGILMATAIARLLTNMWFEPIVLYKTYFIRPIWDYFKIQGILWFVFIFSIIVTSFIVQFVPQVSFIWFIVKIMLCITIPNFIMYVIFRDLEEFHFFENLFKRTFLN